MRTIQKLLLAIAALALPLSGCATSNPKEPCITHVDSDHDGKCDNCGETMPKENLDFVGLSFENKTFTNDGEEHSIYVEGVPEFAEVEYTNNGQTELGTYDVKAKVSAAGYNTKTLTAKLTIKGKEFTGITFKDKEFMQDGYYHYIYVEGAPDFASVTYSNNNGQKTAGTYVITATITAPHYEKLVLTAKLIISNKLPDADIVDRTLIYNGSDQRIVHSIPELPRNTEITYKVDGTTVSEENFCVKTVGDHVASIIISSTDGSRSSSTVNANITVIENNIGGVDSSKTPLKIDENLKYQTLRSKILEGNFTIKKEYFDDYYDPNSKELLESNLDSTTYIYVDGNETFEYFFYTEYSQLVGSQSNYRHTKLKDGEVRSALFEDGILDASYFDSSYIMDGSYYQENVVARTGLKAMAILKEAEDGGFENSSEGNYATEFGSFKIDSENNCFDILNSLFFLEFEPLPLPSNIISF